MTIRVGMKNRLVGVLLVLAAMMALLVIGLQDRRQANFHNRSTPQPRPVVCFIDGSSCSDGASARLNRRIVRWSGGQWIPTEQ